MRVEQFINKNQFVIRGNQETVFQSYQSTCAVIKQNGSLTLGRDWDYSNTTRKHLYLFLEEYHYSMNFETRDLIESALNSNNKKAAIQKLIDNNLINYDENLQ